MSMNVTGVVRRPFGNDAQNNILIDAFLEKSKTIEGCKDIVNKGGLKSLIGKFGNIKDRESRNKILYTILNVVTMIPESKNKLRSPSFWSDLKNYMTRFSSRSDEKYQVAKSIYDKLDYPLLATSEQLSVIFPAIGIDMTARKLVDINSNDLEVITSNKPLPQFNNQASLDIFLDGERHTFHASDQSDFLRIENGKLIIRDPILYSELESTPFILCVYSESSVQAFKLEDYCLYDQNPFTQSPWNDSSLYYVDVKEDELHGSRVDYLAQEKLSREQLLSPTLVFINAVSSVLAALPMIGILSAIYPENMKTFSSLVSTEIVSNVLAPTYLLNRATSEDNNDDEMKKTLAFLMTLATPIAGVALDKGLDYLASQHVKMGLQIALFFFTVLNMDAVLDVLYKPLEERSLNSELVGSVLKTSHTFTMGVAKRVILNKIQEGKST